MKRIEKDEQAKLLSETHLIFTEVNFSYNSDSELFMSILD